MVTSMIRGEKTFEDLKILKTQIEKDVAHIRDIMND